MPEATLKLKDVDSIDLTAAAAYGAGEVIQLPDGRAAVCPVDIASGARGSPWASGIYKISKTANIAILAGGRVYWDHSANTATYQKVNDRDFYIGRAVLDSSESDTIVTVAFNVDPPYDIDFRDHPVLSVPTGTKAVGAFGFPKPLGGGFQLELTATNEAQCIDMLSVDRFAIAAKAIVEFEVRVDANGSDNTVDISLGVGNGTSTTDADAITEHVLAHIDGGSLAINAQSKDGTTTVTATDTTKVFVAGTAVANRFHIWIDMRDSTSVKIYVNGVRVLSGSTFVLTAATGPLGVLAHIEKTAGTATGKITVDRAVARLTQQAA